MALQQCDLRECQNPAERTFGSCMLCSKHLCAEHCTPPHHKCPSSESDPQAYYTTYDTAKQTHLDSLLAKINFDALTSVASKAKSGIRCRIPTLYLGLKQAVLSQIGGQNCQLDLEFDDGVTWIVRLRLCDPLLPPRPFQDYIFLSEVATLKFLAETAVPSPKVVIFTSSNHLET
ncbi:hypothetical protein N7533_012054, partial [Penicillium manginii]|uniref:uncharacterized protein n=1 Tax=Penicillium manginii TaxID=203109 RepID=UPI002548B31B